MSRLLRCRSQKHARPVKGPCVSIASQTRQLLSALPRVCRQLSQVRRANLLPEVWSIPRWVSKRRAVSDNKNHPLSVLDPLNWSHLECSLQCDCEGQSQAKEGRAQARLSVSKSPAKARTTSTSGPRSTWPKPDLQARAYHTFSKSN